MSGAKSTSYLNDALGRRAFVTATGAVTEKIVWPSAGCLSTSMAPMLVRAPGLFSTITFQPSLSDRALAIIRARISGGVEAEFGTTMRMTFDGKSASTGRMRSEEHTSELQSR